MRKTVSIIVPIYNCEKWIQECVDSLIHQSYREIQIILVDDGSTDEGGAICDKLTKRYRQVETIHKINGGVSSARNYGMEAAIGDYIAFVDADDYLDPHILESAVNAIEVNPCDLLCWNAYEIDSETNVIRRCREMPDGYIPIDEFRAAVIADYNKTFYAGKYARAVWGKLFCSKIIKENCVEFQENLYIGEDAVFLLNYLKNTDKVYLVNEYGYYYRLLVTSAVRKYKRDLLEQSLIQYQALCAYLSAEELDTEKIQATLSVFQWRVFHTLISNSIKRHCSIPDHFSDAREWYKLMVNQCRRIGDVAWAGKLVSLQNKIGIKHRFIIQSLLVAYYDWMK